MSLGEIHNINAQSSKSQKAVRTANFTTQQVELLLDSLEACPQLVTGITGGKIPTKRHHKLAWEAVAQKMNESAGGMKTGEQIKSKWYDMKYRARLKASKLLAHKMKETNEPPPESLTPLEIRTLSIIGWKTHGPLINKYFYLPSESHDNFPVNILIPQNFGKTGHASTSENNVIKETPDFFVVNNITQEDLNEDLDELEMETYTEDAFNEVSVSDLSNKIIIEEVHSESLPEKSLNIEKDTVINPSKSDKLDVPSKPNNSSERSRIRRAKKRKLIEDEEEKFERKAIATQERIANDINEIKLSVFEMKNNMKIYMERIDQKFDRMLDLLAVALNVEPQEFYK